MIDELDEALRQVLIREMPIRNGEVDVQFHQPKREWSARLSRPTLNLFLYDVRENLKLRHTTQGFDIQRRGDGTATQRRRPFRADFHYLVTAWATEPEDEHRLLARTLMTLFRLPELPEDLLSDALQEQPVPITLKVAQYDTGQNLSELWGAMDNELRPAITCMVTMAMNPYQPIVGPLVRTRELRFGQVVAPAVAQELVKPAGVKSYWTIGGTIRSEHPLELEKVRLTLVERGLEVKIQPEGRFAIGNLEAGDYTLELTSNRAESRRHRITVPAPDYDLEI